MHYDSTAKHLSSFFFIHVNFLRHDSAKFNNRCCVQPQHLTTKYLHKQPRLVRFIQTLCALFWVMFTLHYKLTSRKDKK